MFHHDFFFRKEFSVTTYTMGTEPQVLNPAEDKRSYSSVWNNDIIGRFHARSMLNSEQAWSAGVNQAGQWMMIELESERYVTGVAVQGRKPPYGQWVKKFKVQTSIDKQSWTNVDNSKVFDGAKFDEINKVLFDQPVTARWVKIIVQEWVQHISMRAGVLVSEKPESEAEPEPETSSAEAEEVASCASWCGNGQKSWDWRCQNNRQKCGGCTECNTTTTAAAAAAAAAPSAAAAAPSAAAAAPSAATTTALSTEAESGVTDLPWGWLIGGSLCFGVLVLAVLAHDRYIARKTRYTPAAAAASASSAAPAAAAALVPNMKASPLPPKVPRLPAVPTPRRLPAPAAATRRMISSDPAAGSVRV